VPLRVNARAAGNRGHAGSVFGHEIRYRADARFFNGAGVFMAPLGQEGRSRLPQTRSPLSCSRVMSLTSVSKSPFEKFEHTHFMRRVKSSLTASSLFSRLSLVTSRKAWSVAARTRAMVSSCVIFCLVILRGRLQGAEAERGTVHVTLSRLTGHDSNGYKSKDASKLAARQESPPRKQPQLSRDPPYRKITAYI
jgi:hypothetical protein